MTHYAFSSPRVIRGSCLFWVREYLGGTLEVPRWIPGVMAPGIPGKLGPTEHVVPPG